MDNFNEASQASKFTTGNDILTTVLAGGLGYVLGKKKQCATKEQVTPIFQGYSSFLDNIYSTFTQAELISLSSSLVKVNYLRSLNALDNELKIQKSKRAMSHLRRCASKSLKTPFATKLVVLQGTALMGETLLFDEGSFAVKNVKIVSNKPEATFLKRGVTDVLSTIFSNTQDSSQVDLLSSKIIGSHNRFNLSPRSSLFEALAFNNKEVKDFNDLQQAMGLYYAYLFSSLSDRSKRVITNENFLFNGFITLNYKEDGCGYLTNFHSLFA